MVLRSCILICSEFPWRACREKIVIPKSMPFITLLGDPASPPIISGNDTAAKMGDNGRALKTFRSPTVAVNSNFFLAAYIQFEVMLSST